MGHLVDKAATFRHNPSLPADAVDSRKAVMYGSDARGVDMHLFELIYWFDTK